MPNKGILPGDIIVSQANAPGLYFYQPLEPSMGNRFSGLTSGSNNGQARLHLEVSPDNNTLLSTFGTTPFIHSRQMDGDGAIVSPPTTVPGAARRCHWHPDGSRFAVTHSTAPFFSQFDSSLNLLTAVTPAPTQITGDVKYSPDGTMVAMGYDAGSGIVAPGFLVYDVASGAAIDTTGAPSLGADCFGLDWSPDSSMLFCIPRTSGTSNFPIAYDVNNWSTPVHSFSGEGVHSLGTQQKYVRFSPSGDKVAFYRGGTSAASVLAVIDTSTWTAITVNASLSAAAINELRWLTNDILAVGQDFLRTIDFSTGAGELMGIQQAYHGATTFCVRPGGVRRFFAGHVEDGSANPLQRVVRAVDRATGRLLAETISDPGDGSFEMHVFSPNPCIVYCVGDGTELTKIEDAVTPAPIV